MRIQLNFGTQKVIIDTLKSILYTQLDTPFYSAGKKYGWDGNTVGLGLAKEILDYAQMNNLTIYIQIGENPVWFYITAKEWANFVDEYNSIWTKDNKEICIIQWSKLKKVEEK